MSATDVSQDIIATWDDEDADNAESYADEIAHRDAGTATLMRSYVKAYRTQQAAHRDVAQRTAQAFDEGDGFDLRQIIRLHARISNAEYYPWMSFETMMHMHYPTFFRYVLEAQEMAKERKKKQGEPENSPEMDAWRLQGLANENKPLIWQGDTTPILE